MQNHTATHWATKVTAALAVVLLLAAKPPTAHAVGTSSVLTGTVAETTNSGGYTYLLVDDGQTKQWVATTAIDVKPGSKVEVPVSLHLKDFYSQRLQRSFPDICFVDNITVDGKQQSTATMAASHPNFNLANLGADDGFAGRVMLATNSGGYTFVCVQGFHKAIWAATKPFPVKVGDSVSMPKGDTMPQFHSVSLNQTFDEIRFVDHIENLSQLGGKHPPAATATNIALPPGHPPGATSAVPRAADEQIAQPAGAKSVAEIFAQRRQLAGQEITIKGRVTKFTPSVMGHNWIHISDGTGAAGNSDLTITTDEIAAVGDVITVHGKVAIDQDFGFGYAYSVLLEKAAVQKN